MEKNTIKLVNKYLRGKASPEEIKALFTLFLTSEAKKELFEHYEQVWNASDKEGNHFADSDKKKIWSEINKSIKRNRPFRVFSLKSSWWKVAAAVLIPLIFLWIGYKGSSYLAIDSKDLIVNVDRGQKVNMILPDGSSVRINSASQIRYNNKFNQKNRTIYLSGEAYFDVKSNPDKPFIVETIDGLSIKALGTKFNVKAYEEDSEVSSTLIEGSIQVGDHRERYVLEPAEQIVYKKRSRKFEKTCLLNSKDALSWMEDRLFFNGESLYNISKVLERMYSVDIHFGSEDIKEITFSGKIKNNSLSSILNLIISVSPEPIEYMVKDSAIIINKIKKY